MERQRNDDIEFGGLCMAARRNVGLGQDSGAHEADGELAVAGATVAAAMTAVAAGAPIGAPDLLAALARLHWMQAALTAIEPALIDAARSTGVSWHALAPVLGVASRQAAERRYLRLAPAGEAAAATRDGRVRAERDRRAGQRAVTRWANDNTADLRALAGQITALDDLGDDATAPLRRLHEALAGPDASTLPALLADTQQHLNSHPELANQIDSITAHTERLKHRTQQDRDASS